MHDISFLIKKISTNFLTIHRKVFVGLLRKKQCGFTLTELMVVMTIIALLASIGAIAYIGFTKDARDAQRISDIATMDAMMTDFRRSTGLYPTTQAAFDTMIKNTNHNTAIQDPLAGKVACIHSNIDTSLTYCEYIFHSCDDGDGYLISTKFETVSHAKKYTPMPGESVPAWYNIGPCETLIHPIPPPPPSIPDGGLCENKGQCLPERVCVGPPEKKCRPKHNQTQGADCSINDDCISRDCHLSSGKCKK